MLTESAKALLRCEREHEHCKRRWEAMRREDPDNLLHETLHDWEAHMLPNEREIHDWRDGAPKR